MAVFDLYAAYYDLLYRAKDYAGEVDWLLSLLPRGELDILELGCGTGGHACELAARGHRVLGVDLSRGMVGRARERARALPAAQASRLRFEEGDLRDYRSGRRHDAVIALFHVICYQTGNEDLAQAMATARAHLEPGGRFVFDFWYGPAVLCDRPRHVRIQVEDERVQVDRTTTPSMRTEDNVVDVRFDLRIRDVTAGREELLTELHPMRYLFLPELDQFLKAAGMRRSVARTWLSNTGPDEHRWYACVVAEAV